MLTITVGLPGSGKTTWARQQRATCISRDDMRMLLFNKKVSLAGWQECLVTIVCYAVVKEALAYDDVIVHDTNLQAKVRNAWRRLAKDCGVDYAEQWFDVDVATCIERQAMRPESDRVPPEVIIRMQERRS